MDRFEKLLPIARKIAIRYARTPFSQRIGGREDVIQEAYIGVAEAIKRFNPEHPEADLIRYVKRYVFFHLRHAACNMGKIRLPSNLVGKSARKNGTEKAKKAIEIDSLTSVPAWKHPPLPEKKEQVQCEVKDLLRFLPQQERIIIERRYGFIGDAVKTEPLAAELGINIRSLMKRHKSAIIRLKKLMAKERSS